LSSRKNINRQLGGAALAALVTILSGCNEDDLKLAFSHYLHVTENEIECADCHGEIAEGLFASAGHAACVDCHDDTVESHQISEDTCGVCHKVKNIEEWMPQHRKPPHRPDRVFVHTELMADHCDACHGSLLDENLDHAPKVTPKDRIQIRQKSHRSGMDCAVCHVDMDPDTPPASHRRQWTRLHGDLGMQSDNTCGICHSRESCRECHQVMLPASHNTLWRLKTHGIRAAWDRERCMVCHQQDSCEACHANTRPVSHRAGWSQSHCFSCHPSQSTGTGCTLCHEATLDSHPNPHGAGWRSSHCSSCHPGSPAAEQCNACHAGAGNLNSHPSPHSAGWRSRHCDSCHFGSSAAQECGICHSDAGQTGGHPNPHSAGWQSRHCNNCHAGDECTICHPGGNSVLVHEDFWPPVHDRFGDQADCNDCH